MSRSLLDDWEYDIRRCCKEDIPMEMMDIAEDIYNTAYQSGVTEVLDKIRVEIEQSQQFYEASMDYLVVNAAKAEALSWALDVIDKYKAESEK